MAEICLLIPTDRGMFGSVLKILPLRQEVRHSTLTAVYIGSNPIGVVIYKKGYNYAI